MTGVISIWTWIVVFGYFFADTNITILMRILLVKKWYQAHKSHAYQNIARVLKSHVKVTGTIQIYHFLYLLPITIWTVLVPNWAPVAAIMALMPAAIITYCFGPRFSSD
jgi:Fuc2NAc and GlcNAc transferase